MANQVCHKRLHPNSPHRYTDQHLAPPSTSHGSDSSQPIASAGSQETTTFAALPADRQFVIIVLSSFLLGIPFKTPMNSIQKLILTVTILLPGIPLSLWSQEIPQPPSTHL